MNRNTRKICATLLIASVFFTTVSFNATATGNDTVLETNNDVMEESMDELSWETQDENSDVESEEETISREDSSTFEDDEIDYEITHMADKRPYIVDNSEDSDDDISVDNLNNSPRRMSKNKSVDFYDRYKEYIETSTYISAINCWAGSSGPNLYYGNGTETINQIATRTATEVKKDGREKDANITSSSTHVWCFHTDKYDDCYVLEKSSNGKYIVTEVIWGDNTLPNYTKTYASKVPPKDGFILFADIANNQKYPPKLRNFLTLGTEISLTFDMNDYIYSLSVDKPVGKLEFVDEPIAEQKQVVENDLPTIGYASTKGKVNINIFDYDETINNKWKIDHEFPGFNNPSKNPETLSSSANGWHWAALGDIIAKDIKGADENIVNKGAINKGTGNTPFIVSNSAVLDSRITADGFPQMKNGVSLDYLFSNSDGVTQENKPGLDGLFQYDPETYTYYFNSRENIAIYNKSTNMFELYDGMLTPNYTTYLFGNFLPFNDVKKAKRVTEIDRSYLVDLLESCVYKINRENDEIIKIQYKAMIDYLYNYISIADLKFGNRNWTYLDSMNDVFKTIGFHKDSNGKFVPLTDNDLDFSKLYNIDFDDEKNFWFGMSQEVNFYQPEDGMVGRNNAYEMTYKFTGDDDFWLYIDGDLFIDLTGVHRHHGAEINFTKGTVSYYQTDVNNDGDLIEEPVLVKTFSEIVSDQSKLNDKGTFKDISDYMLENRTDFIEGYDEAKVMKECSHNLKLFYMERGSGSGICRMNFNFPIIETRFENAEINLNIEKEITSENNAFDRLALNNEEEYNFEIVLKELMNVGNEEMLSGKIINGMVSNKNGLTIKGISAGKYVISESDSMYFDFMDFEVMDDTGAVTLRKQDDKYILEIDSTKIIPNETYYMKVKNIPENERYYNNKYDLINIFGL